MQTGQKVVAARRWQNRLLNHERYINGVLKVRIQAPADKGKANDELIDFLSESLKIPKNHIKILSGQTSRIKKLEIQGNVPPEWI